MAERRPPGFNVPLGFYDGPEVKSIPRRIRAAAVGVWTLCGTFSANKLQDGYVGAETLKELCCTDAIRSALMSTKGPDGDPDPLWVAARDGGVQFTKWVKYQRSRVEVKAYLAADAERKRIAREARRNALTSKDSEVSGRTPDGHPPDVRSTETKTETETISTYVPDEDALNVDPTRPDLSPAVDRSASRLVADIIGNGADGYSNTVLAKLRINASQLAHEVGAEVTAETLRIWKTKSHLGPDALAQCTAEAAKSIHQRNGPPPVGRSDAKANEILTAATRLARQSETHPTPEIEARQ